MIFNNDSNQVEYIISPARINNEISRKAISIALKFKDKIISGVIFDPIKNEMFYAEKNGGSFYNNQRINLYQFILFIFI